MHCLALLLALSLAVYLMRIKVQCKAGKAMVHWLLQLG